MANRQHTSRSGAARLGLLRDFPEERWPSMDLCADMLAKGLREQYPGQIDTAELCPPFRRRLQRLSNRSVALNADRLLNRFWDYPRAARKWAREYDLFHLVDHSYSQVLHSLPAGRAGVYCHDLDTFRCLLKPEAEPRPKWFRAMARRILTGFQRAAIVFHSTAVIRDQIVQYRLIDPARLVHAPLGFAQEYRIDPPDDPAADAILTSLGSRPFLLHVGSCIPRKRIDILLDTFARLRQTMPELWLVKVGGEWTTDQRGQIERLGLADHIKHTVFLSRPALACLYRRANLVVMTSDAEGFGLPVIEALACGSPVLVSDLPVFRDVAGAAARFAPPGDAVAFAKIAREWMQRPDGTEAEQKRVAQANCYSWAKHAAIIGDAYLRFV